MAIVRIITGCLVYTVGKDSTYTKTLLYLMTFLLYRITYKLHLSARCPIFT